MAREPDMSMVDSPRITRPVLRSEWAALIALVQETSEAAVDRAIKKLDARSREVGDLSVDLAERYHIAAAHLRDLKLGRGLRDA